MASHDADGRRRRLESLGTSQCWQLVADRGVGRVAFMGDTRLRIVPTRYDAEGHTAYFRALTFGELARGGHDRHMSLQVDDVDHESFTGWSVLMSGMAHRVEDAATIASLWSLGRPHPWVSGPETQWIALVVDTIEGQRVAA
jgi:nitroimidazol reductase NimA-like FMN-containing flavoprotein (pyridoxamine 5'-phosphate oxidase superfamily)